MTNGLIYWIAVWGVMAAAFGLAWMFIVKGCERLDAAHPDLDPNLADASNNAQSVDAAEPSTTHPSA